MVRETCVPSLENIAEARRPKKKRGRRRRAQWSIEYADAKARKQRRREYGSRARRVVPRDLRPGAARASTIKLMLELAGVQPGTVAAFELLQAARDQNNRQLLYGKATQLLR